MMYPFKNKFTCSALGAAAVTLTLLPGCGGGGGGGGTSTPAATPVPSPLNATYNATFVPTGTIPADGKAPMGTATLAGSRATSQTTYFLQPSVVTFFQKQVDDGLRSNNVGFAIPDNQIPQSIAFSGSGQLDGSGKVVLTSRKFISICGTATITIDPTFTTDGTTASGSGNYRITFPNNLVAKVRGQEYKVERDNNGNVLTCNNLPLLTGTVTYTKVN